MRLQIRQFLALSGLTALEALRQPICLLLAATCTVFVSLLPFLITHTLGEAGKLVRDGALALHLVCGLLMGSFISCGSLVREIDRGTAASILSKPVNRSLFFLAKYAGMAVAMLLFSAAMAVSTMLAARAASQAFFVDWWAAGPLLAATPAAFALAAVNNYFTRRPFVSNAFGLLLFALAASFCIGGLLDRSGRWVAFGSAMPLATLPASILVTMAILVLSAVALALATRLKAMPTILVCSLVLAAGLLSDYLFGRHAADSRLMSVLYRVVPNWQNFWAADALSGGAIPWAYVGVAGVYAAFYLAAVLALGILFFHRLEIRS